MRAFIRTLYVGTVKKTYKIGLILIYLVLFIALEENTRSYLSGKYSHNVCNIVTCDSLLQRAHVSWHVLYICQIQNGPPFVLPGDDEHNSCFINRKNSRPNIPGGKYRKEVFLTFDDGPSNKNTPEILKVLNKYNAKATFFIVGNVAEGHRDILKKLMDSGMCILPHSYTHTYEIYSSQQAYFNDLNRCIEVIENLTGKRVPPFTRMPGGSSSSKGSPSILSKIKNSLINRSIKYVDWNVSSSDALSATVNSEIIKKSVESQCRNKDVVVILMHDSPTKSTTVEALPDIINYLKNNGYTFRTFKDISQQEEYDLIKRKIINR